MQKRQIERQRKYHFIYKTTNLINSKYYIGMHSTDNLDDGYIGSGTRLWRSIEYYGKENFKVEILEFLPDRLSLKEREHELVNKEKLIDNMCMNLKVGGNGGWYLTPEQYVARNAKCSKRGGLATGPKNGAKKFKELNDSGFSSRKFSGKKHSDETKRKIGLIPSVIHIVPNCEFPSPDA